MVCLTGALIAFLDLHIGVHQAIIAPRISHWLRTWTRM
jgi:hypothetical protein